jgi:hypothetical protein
MISNKLSLWLGAALLVCCALPAAALDAGLYLVEGSNDYYYIDSSGTRHLVQNFDALKPRFFADMPVVKTRMDLLNDIPTGEVITETTAPKVIVKKTTTTTTTTTSGSRRLARGLYMVEGSNEYVFIDDEGRRHVVSDYPSLKTKFFSDMPVQTVKTEVISDLPVGEVITETSAPTIIIDKD